MIALRMVEALIDVVAMADRQLAVPWTMNLIMI